MSGNFDHAALNYWNAISKHIFLGDSATSEDLARMGGNAIALRAAAVAIIMTMKAVDPMLMQRYLHQSGWFAWEKTWKNQQRVFAPEISKDPFDSECYSACRLPCKVWCSLHLVSLPNTTANHQIQSKQYIWSNITGLTINYTKSWFWIGAPFVFWCRHVSSNYGPNTMQPFNQICLGKIILPKCLSSTGGTPAIAPMMDDLRTFGAMMKHQTNLGQNPKVHRKMNPRSLANKK